MTTFDNFPRDLYFAKKLVYDQCDFEFTEFKAEDESQDYSACTFKLNGLAVKFRVSKITPTKTGQFVTIWKRNPKGITEPFSISDEIDFVIISSRRSDNFGQFIFPKSELLAQGIFSEDLKRGKRGIRVYPPWEKATSQQAEKTQRWQLNYFITIHNNISAELALAKKLLKND